jgi:HlyD family secretion protein
VKSLLTKAVLVVSVLLVLPCPPAAAQEKIGALGRIQPRGGIVDLVGPQGDRIAEIRVEEGQHVRKGETLVVFDSRNSCRLELKLAELAAREADEWGAKAVEVQRTRLREADEVGRKAVAVQEQRVRAARVEYDFAVKALERFKKADGQSVSEQMMDQRQGQVAATEATLRSAEQELGRLRLEREIHVRLAGQELERLELERAIKMQRTGERLRLAQDKLRRSTLEAPSDGTVLEILLCVGEGTGAAPVLRMADLGTMVVVAEIFEGDLLNLERGMKATITGNALPGTLTGEIETIGRIVDPSNRTANVSVRLHDPGIASRLINLEVDVTILH